MIFLTCQLLACRIVSRLSDFTLCGIIRKFLTKSPQMDYIHNIYCKGNEEEEYILPLIRESGCRKVLRGCLKEGMWKVASEPEDPEL